MREARTPHDTIIRTGWPRHAKEADAHFQKKYGKPLADFYDDSKYQLMHLESSSPRDHPRRVLGGDTTCS